MSFTSKFNLPIVVVVATDDIVNSIANKESVNVRKAKAVTLYVYDNGGSNSLSDTPYSISATMRVRGNSTVPNPFVPYSSNINSKLQYSVKLDSDKGIPSGTKNLLNMPDGGKHWVFDSVGVYDLSFIRNALAFYLESAMGDLTKQNNWAPRSKYFEMFLFCEKTSKSAEECLAKIKSAPETYYHGVYLNCEKIRPEKSRVDIKKYKVSDGTDHVGSIMVQLNDVGLPNPNGKPHYIQLTQGANINCSEHPMLYRPENKYFYQYDAITKDKSKEAIVKSQELKIKNWFYASPDFSEKWYGYGMDWVGWAGMFTASNKADWQDKIPELTDFTSFAQYLLLNEICKDPDGYHRSTFMYKEADAVDSKTGDITPGKMFAGPLWDKDKSFSNKVLSYLHFTSSELWTVWYGGQAPIWWSVLLQRSDFQSVVREVWQDCQNTVFEPGSLALFFTGLNNELSLLGTDNTSPVSRNVTRWGIPTSVEKFQNDVQALQSYLSDRIIWMDDNFDSLFTQPQPPYPPA